MNKLKKISTYLKERSPLPAITFLSAGIGVSAMAAKEGFNLTLFLISIVLNNFLFIQMRLADEIKDFETDKVINPTRPLPRGLFTTTEVLKLLIGIFSILILSSLAVTFIYSPLGGVSLLVASIFSWLMFKEFYISHQLDKSPMFYALTHQVVVFPLFAWVGLAYDSTLIHNHLFQGWLLANFGASFTFEICRKLDPRAHVLAKTYAHHYGRNKTVGLCLIFLIISAIGAIWAGFAAYSIPALCLLLLGLLAWRSNPEKYKLPAGLSALSSAIILWSPAIMWLLRSWSNK